MEFKERRPIYIQIADALCERILNGEWKENERIPSIRELAVEIEVNPNTVTRTFGYLQDKEIIYNKRGIGYFVSEDAVERTRRLKREDFLKEEIPFLFRSMQVLGIAMPAVEELYEKYIDAEGER